MNHDFTEAQEMLCLAALAYRDFANDPGASLQV